MNSNVAVVTMVYNEPQMLGLWQKYYCGQVGSGSCYVIDHGSSDGSAADLPVNVVRIPRSPMDDVKRARFLSGFCSSLLEWYETVIYTDVDEFLIPDPERYASLANYCDKMTSPVATAIGLNVQHLSEEEDSLDWTRPVLRQRRWARFSLAMCKPLIVKVPIKWSPGFHFSDHATVFDDLFLFHLHHFDLPTALKRLSKTRSMTWSQSSAGSHQRIDDDSYEKMMIAVSGLRKEATCTFRHGDLTVQKYTAAVLNFMEKNPEKRNRFYVDSGITSNELLKIPERFLDLI